MRVAADTPGLAALSLNSRRAIHAYAVLKGQARRRSARMDCQRVLARQETASDNELAVSRLAVLYTILVRK